MNPPLSAADDLRVVNALRDNLSNTPGLSGVHGGVERAQELLALIRTFVTKPGVVFRYLGADEARGHVFEVG
ncbi:MAG: hypothetical protein RIS88_1686, partial [Pseudomonadota bacterium]